MVTGIKEDIKSLAVEERNYSYKFMVIFQHISCCYAEYNLFFSFVFNLACGRKSC